MTTTTQTINLNTITPQQLGKEVAALETGDRFTLESEGRIVGRVRPTNECDVLSIPYLEGLYGMDWLLKAKAEVRPKRVKLTISDFGDLRPKVIELLALCRDQKHDLTIHVTCHKKPSFTITAL